MKKVITLLAALALFLPGVFSQNYVFDQYGAIDNGYTEQSSYDGRYRVGYRYLYGQQTYVADDFTVGVEGMSVFGAKFVSAIESIDYMTAVNMDIYADNGGMPADDATTSLEITEYRMTELSTGVYEFDFNFDVPVVLTEGSYWVSFYTTGQGLDIISDSYNGYVYCNDDTARVGSACYKKVLVNTQGGYLPSPVWEEAASTTGNEAHTNLHFALKDGNDVDLSLSNITAPSTGVLGSAELVTFDVKNIGKNDATGLTAYLEVTSEDGTVYHTNDGVNNYISELVTFDAISTGESTTVSFSTGIDMSGLGDYNVKVWFEIVDDADETNNEAEISVTNYGAIYAMGSAETVTACYGVFTQDSGLEGEVTEASYDTITFYPGTPGDRSVLTFEYFNLSKSYYTNMTIYDGENTEAAVLYNHGNKYYDDPSDLEGLSIRALNPTGALTVVVTPYNTLATGQEGWLAHVSCMTPNAIEFEAMDFTPIEFGSFGKKAIANTATFVYRNTGVDTVSRNIYLIENNELVSTTTSAVLVPGMYDTIEIAWTPSSVGETVLKVMLADDSEMTNEDNYMMDTLKVYKTDSYTCSFEDINDWYALDVIESDYTTHAYYYVDESGYYFDHGYAGFYARKDTIVLPRMAIDPVIPEVIEVAVMSSFTYNLFASENSTGPWELVGSEDISAGEHGTFDVSAYKGQSLYFAIQTESSNSRIDWVTGGKLDPFDADLKALSLEFTNLIAKTNLNVDYSVSIFNQGSTMVSGSDYLVHLRTAEQIYATTAGIDVESLTSATFTLHTEFAEVDTLELYAEIEFANDLYLLNNTSESHEFIVLDSYVSDMEGESEGTSSNGYMYNGQRYASATEVIYYPSEVGGAANISGFDFAYSYTKTGEYKMGAEVYLAHVADSVLLDETDTKVWFDTTYADFTKVFDDSVTLTYGSNNYEQRMYIPFDQEFEYNGEDNLIVLFLKDNYASVYGSVYNQVIKAVADDRILVGYTNAADTVDPGALNTSLTYTNSYQTNLPKLRFYLEDVATPYFTSSPVEVAELGVEYMYNFSYENGVVEALTLPEWLTFYDGQDGAGAIYGTPEMAGTYEVELLVSNGGMSKLQSFSIYVAAVPTFTSTPVETGMVGEAYSYAVTVDYTGEGVVAFSGAADNPSWLTVTDNGDGTATVAGTPDATGTFTVTIYAAGEATAEQTYSLVIEENVGIVDLAGRVNLYPNPAQNMVTIENAANAQVNIYNVAGKLVFAQQLNAEKEVLDLSDLSTGVYVVRVHADKVLMNERLVIE